jgi:hypothetical protein
MDGFWQKKAALLTFKTQNFGYAQIRRRIHPEKAAEPLQAGGDERRYLRGGGHI